MEKGLQAVIFPNLFVISCPLVIRLLAKNKETIMQITKIAVAGTLESSDAQVRIEPANTLNIELNSSVGKQFGDDILATIKEVLTQFDVTAAQVTVEDKGALDCVLRARLKAALLRATDEQIDWGKVL